MQNVKSFLQLVNVLKSSKDFNVFTAYQKGYYHTEIQQLMLENDVELSDKEVTSEVFNLLAIEATEDESLSDYIEAFGLENVITAGLVATGSTKESAVALIKEASV